MGEILYWIGAAGTLFLVPFLLGKYSSYKPDHIVELFLVGMMMVLLALVWPFTVASIICALVFKFANAKGHEKSRGY